MTKLIKNKQVVEDSWLLISDKTLSSTNDLPKEKIILPLQAWLSLKNEFSDPSTIGVWLDSDEEPSLLGENINEIPLIAINFPSFADGRGYSYASLLRQRKSYQGEIRAIGDVLRDQLFYMQRCGFNSFVMRENDRSEEALDSLEDFSDTYQSSAANPEPLFLRR